MDNFGKFKCFMTNKGEHGVLQRIKTHVKQLKTQNCVPWIFPAFTAPLFDSGEKADDL